MTKRDAILKACDQIFGTMGYGLAGVDAIAALAGVTKRTLYKQFGSKEELFTHWLRRRDHATRTAMFAAIDAIATDPREQIVTLFSVLAQVCQNPDFHGCPFSRALIEFGATKASEAGQKIALEHKAALTIWFEDRLKAAGFVEVSALSEELALLYEGTLARSAMTRSPQAALAAKRLIEMRLMAEN